MAEVDIPKRVIVVLLVLVILVSFLGTLTLLQLYASSPRAVHEEGDSRATLSINLLSPWTAQSPLRQSDDSSTVSVKINKYQE